ncbi:uncharacterized protein NPIL_660701 [Nephila pilipes]|uniref:Uncharacterized protein n=1 Tax=Nephila pilipes TaxID=299642 RepID=A0A8X6T960_NEPPI|nr:uncharacterized protein NPIL_660701 [Nephila pilipes]
MVDEEIMNSEKKKIIIILTVTKNNAFDYLTNVSVFEKIVRITAWIRNFIENCENSKTSCTKKYLEVEEMKEAETLIWRMVRKASLRTVKDERLCNLPFFDPFLDPFVFLESRHNS